MPPLSEKLSGLLIRMFRGAIYQMGCENPISISQAGQIWQGLLAH